MLGKTISHYKILEKLGGGGMGVVYKGEDIKLKRLVALKFLPQDLTRDEQAKERFMLEAQAASALDHPNVCNIYEIGEGEDGQLFIAMACYEGQTLKEKIAHVGANGRSPLATDEVIAIAIQIAEGLGKAHEKEIVHRDIKPANIIITNDGVAKIVDFGLAKLAGQSRLTKTGTTLGTVAYMSPEQTKGGAVDHRTDIWSLGVLLYEMVTGDLPFRGEYEQAVFYSILNEEPEPLPELPKEVPVEFETVVRNCLEKEPADRYQTADELLADLQQLQAELKPGGLPFKRIVRKRLPQKPLRILVLPATLVLVLAAAIAGYFFFGKEAKGVERVPIAVVDFVNETDERELDGLSGMLITSLEQSRRLSVLTRSRMFDILKQMGKEKVERIDETLGREICQQAGVNAMALASVKKLGRVYTIDLKVLDTEKDEYLFTDLAQGEGQESVLTMIDNLSKRTREEFNEPVEQIQAASQKVAEVTTQNFEAYQHYFRGEQYIKKFKVEEAEEEFRKAIALDSTFGLAYYRLATTKAWFFGEENLAREPMQKALALIDRIPERQRYLVRAQQARFEKGFEASLTILREMENSYPEDDEMLYHIGYGLYWTGQFAGSVDYLERYLAHDAQHQYALEMATKAYQQLEHYEKMAEMAQQFATVARSARAYDLLAKSHMHRNDHDKTIEILMEAKQFLAGNPSFTLLLADYYMFQGRYEEAEAELALLRNESLPSDVRRLGEFGMNLINLYRGRYREALTYHDKWIEIMMQNDRHAQAATQHMEKAKIFFYGWNDMTNATRSFEKLLRVQKRVNSPFLATAAASYYAITDQQAAADSIIQLIKQIPSLNWFPPFVSALTASAQGECQKVKAVADHPMLRGGYRHVLLYVLYLLAKCQFEQGELDQAVVSVHQMRAIYSNGNRFRALFYPKSLLLLAKVYEQKGEPKRAMEELQEFLDLWMEADEDLPDLIDAKARLARLKG